jgi:hypothetical protein
MRYLKHLQNLNCSLLSAVLENKEKSKVKRRKIREELTREAQEFGLGY